MASKLKELAKGGGWHPEKPGQNFRQQVVRCIDVHTGPPPPPPNCVSLCVPS